MLIKQVIKGTLDSREKELDFTSQDKGWRNISGQHFTRVGHCLYFYNQYYKVTVTADIMSAKQDRGDRLYWVDGIKDMLLVKIDEPQLKDTTPRTLTVQAYQYNKAIDLLCKADISVV